MSVNFNQKTFAFGTRRFYDRPNEGFSREPFINKKDRIPDLDKGPSKFLGFIICCLRAAALALRLYARWV